jgi:hypothetical protein
VFHFNRVSVKPEKTLKTKHAGEINENTNSMKSTGSRGFSHAGRQIQPYRFADSVIRACRQQGGIDGHPAPFSVAFATEVLPLFLGIVYDPFLGSGTTLIAAEQLGRKCYGMEISPAYCDVIVKRWETLTGRKATLAT